MEIAEALWMAAAAALERPEGAPREALDLLAALGIAPAAEAGPGRRHRAALLRAAARFTRIFRLEPPEAPGLVVFGAEFEPARFEGGAGLPPAFATGSGPTPLAAFESCVGEAVEYLSQLEPAGTKPLAPAEAAALPDGGAGAMLEAAGIPAAGISWLPARSLPDGAPARMPRDLCLRRPPDRRDFAPPSPLSIGCAAGATAEEAGLHALFELIERDAAALWWRGGRRGRPLALEASDRAAALLAGLRQGRGGRASWLLDITTDLAIPVIAALSCDEEGFGFCCGIAARATASEAAAAAIRELCQTELAHAVVRAKRAEHGVLNAVDEAHLRRAREIDANRTELLHASGAPAIGTPPQGNLAALTEHLARRGFHLLVADLTRGLFAVPVLRLACYGLEREPCAAGGARLRDTIAAWGGGDRFHGGMPLF